EEGRLEERNTNSQKQIDEKSLLLNQEKLLRENCSLELSKIQLESSALEQQLSFISENENRVIGEIRKLKDEDASLEAGKKAHVVLLDQDLELKAVIKDGVKIR
ncbi:MAG: hypothetical protein EGQ94_02720, partial [Ruminococcus sp.]|nr:hypothetical protein [Ruminococcus sp.]